MPDSAGSRSFLPHPSRARALALSPAPTEARPRCVIRIAPCSYAFAEPTKFARRGPQVYEITRAPPAPSSIRLPHPHNAPTGASPQTSLAAVRLTVEVIQRERIGIIELERQQSP